MPTGIFEWLTFLSLNAIWLVLGMALRRIKDLEQRTKQKDLERMDRRLIALEQAKAQMDGPTGLTPANVKNCG